MGGILLAIGCVWLGWIVLSSYVNTHVSSLPTLKIPGFSAVSTPPAQIPALLAAGVVLDKTDQKPTLDQDQALLLASQFEPVAAARAKSTVAQYVSLNYTNTTSTPVARSSFKNVPVWLIWYQKVPLDTSDATSVDPKPSSRSTRDLYIFLDANSGKQLLVISI